MAAQGPLPLLVTTTGDESTSRDATMARGVSDERAAKSAQSCHVTPGDLMRQRRLEFGLSQKEAATRAGISREEWNGLERGRRGIGMTNATRIARVLGGEPDEYLSRAVQPDIVELRQRLTELEARVAKLEDASPRSVT
jgi:plasmid maintenance system antidote protein VapI